MTWIKLHRPGTGCLTCINTGCVGQCSMMSMQQVLLLKGIHAIGAARDVRLLEGVLSSLPLFRGMAPRQVQQIAAQSRLQNARRGELLCRRGAAMPGLFVVAYGMLKLALRRNDREEKVVRFLRAGESFGEASVLLERPCPVDAVALEASMLVVVPSAAIARLLHFEQTFARNMAGALAERLLGMLQELEASVQHSGLQRLARYLDSVAEPGAHANCSIARLPATKTTVAARLGVKKETLSRMLRDLAERGLIKVTGREVAILDRDALARIAGIAA